MLVFFTNVSLMEFQVRYLALFHLFSVIDGFEWFWIECIHKNIQLILEFLKFLNYTLMTLLMMLSVILVSMLMILLSILSMIRRLIYGKNLTSELESDLQDTVDWVRSGLLISLLGKRSWFGLTGVITMVLLM